jgi:hypothetical protein
MRVSRAGADTDLPTPAAAITARQFHGGQDYEIAIMTDIALNRLRRGT